MARDDWSVGVGERPDSVHVSHVTDLADAKNLVAVVFPADAVAD